MFLILLSTIVSIVSANKIPTNNSTFRPDPIESVMLDDVEYSFYNYRVTWEEAKIICSGFKSQLATLNTQSKVIYVTRQLADSNPEFEELWIGSKRNLHGHWIWDASDEKISSNTFFHNSTSTLKYLNHSVNDLYCLALFRRHYHIPLLIPRRCSEQKPFICEKDTFSMDNIMQVFSVKIGKKMLVLYSANLTWSEAVFQCRQQGLQIAEISTLTEARNVAVGMLKVRPRSIESAWIAGHLNNRIWKWLSSGVDIPRNELWQNSHFNSGNCLLLDRHVCQRPRYLSLRCDRRRDFICQTPQKEQSTTGPSQVTIDDCKYWIVGIPLEWNEANQFCKKLNSTLVSLDSPVTVNHIANIMLDNKELLPHIWIGGKKEFDRDNFGKWKWDKTGIDIPGPGQSFIPWCNDSRLFEQNSDCLNMDLEDVDEPVVYGLNCNNKQQYICQEGSTICAEMKNISLPIPKRNMSAVQFEATTRFDEFLYNTKESLNTFQDSSRFIQSTTKLSSNDLPEKPIPRIHDQDSSRFIQGTTKMSSNDLPENPNPGIHHKPKNTHDTELKNDTVISNVNAKNNITELNKIKYFQQSLSMKNRNFKDIIEYMVKKANDERSEANRKTSDRSLLDISNQQNQDEVSDRSNKSEKILSIKENVSKIVQLSMEKNWQNTSSIAPFTSIHNAKILLTDNSSPYPKSEIKRPITPVSRNLFSTQVDRPLPKNQRDWSNSLSFESSNPSTMFNLGQVMRNTFDKNHVNKFHTHEVTESMNVHKTHEVNRSLHNTMRNKNEISTLLSTSTQAKGSIQSLKNNENENAGNIKVNDLINAFHSREHDPSLKQGLLSMQTDNILDSKKNPVYPWNVLMNRIVQSYNHTNKSIVGFKVVEFP